MPEFKSGESSEPRKDDVREPVDPESQDERAPQNPDRLDSTGAVLPRSDDRGGLADAGVSVPTPHPDVAFAESVEPVIVREATGNHSPNSPGKSGRRGSWRLFFGRNVGERAGVVAAITGVIALVVAVFAWLHPFDPDPPKSAEGVTASNDVPEDYLGTWQGTIKMNPILVGSLEPVGIDKITIQQASIGKSAAEQIPIDWGGQETGCSRTWKLFEVRKDRILLEAVSAVMINMEGKEADIPLCMSDLSMSVLSVNHDTIDVSTITSKPNGLLPAGISIFTGTLKRQN